MHSFLIRMSYIVSFNIWIIIEIVYTIVCVFLLVKFRQWRKVSIILSSLLALATIITTLFGNDVFAGMIADLLLITLIIFFCKDIIVQRKNITR